MSDTTNSQLKSSGSVSLGARIEIFPSMPLPDCDSVGGKAYAARYRNESTADLCALICTTNMLPRFEAINSMRSIDNPAIVRFIESGVVQWENGRAYALVFQRPLAPAMMRDFNETRTPLSEDTINHNFITPMIGALTTLMATGVIHNAIRPSNIFWRIGTTASPQLGECLSVPAGVGQPVLFEPIERALATPVARGQGQHIDDCYAFGVTLALLVLGRNPLQGMDDATLIDIKMQRSTFGALIGTSRLSPTHIEILRGLLADDPHQRWTGANLEQWLSGRRMTPKSSDAGKRATRHFDFLGKEYWQAAPLASAMAANLTEAAKIVENDQLGKWLRRSLNDPDRADNLVRVIEELKESGKSGHYEDQVVARACITLDPTAPIRYRGLSVMPGGIAPMLVEATGTNAAESTAVLAEILASQLPLLWVEIQNDASPEYIAMVQTFDRMKGLIDKTSLGSGIERVCYELNPSVPCLSPMLRGQYVTGPKLLLPALERVAGSGNRPREPMDRHIAAFLIAREKRGENLFSSMSGPEGSIKRGLAMLTLFSELQYRHGPENLPQLAGWIAPLVEPALKSVLSKNARERVQKKFREAVSSGNLNNLLRAIDDPQRQDRDKQEFIAARLLYLNIQKEIVGLEAKINNRESVVRAAGKPMAASISSFLAILLMCAAILRALAEALFL